MRGIDDLEAANDATAFLGVTYYLNAPYAIDDGIARFSGYGFTGTPSVMFDGVTDHVGGTGSGSMIGTYQPTFAARRAVPSPLLLDARYVSYGTTGTVTVDLEVDLAVTTAENELQVLVCRDGHHGQSNLVVGMPEPVAVTVAQPGETEQLAVDFALATDWPQEELRIIVLVQDAASGEIVQAGVAAPDYKADVSIACEPAGVGAGWTLSGPEGFHLEGAGQHAMSLFFTGEYTLVWDDVPHWTEPAVNPQVLNVAQDGTIAFTGTYTDGPFARPAAGDEAAPGPAHAAVLVDYDDDGAPDLHVPREGAADLLLRNTAGTFTDVAAGAAADVGAGRAAAWHDIDGDGHLDYALARGGEPVVLHTGDGTGGFGVGNLFGAESDGEATSASWMDYDGDGLLDLYLTNRGAPNELWRYNGVFGGGYLVFTEEDNGARVGGNTGGAVWHDIDGDGRMDLYVLTEFGANVLLQNTPLGFSDVTPSTGLGDVGNAAAAAWGDFDGDGDMDLYLANDGTADVLWRTGGWDRYSVVPGEHLGDMGTARDVVWADLDNDTHLDLYVVRRDEADLMLMGHGDGTFTRVPVGPAETLTAGRAVTCGDVDGDGLLDLYLVRENADNVLLTNDFDGDNHWLAMILQGPEGNRRALGARVRVTTAGGTIVREVAGRDPIVAGGSVVHVGLGDQGVAEEVEIAWPDGTLSIHGPFAADQVLVVDRTVGVSASDDDPDELPAAETTLGRARPNPFNPATTIDFTLGRGGRVRLDVYDVAGRRVCTLVDDELAAGPHTATWHGEDASGRPAASGTYLYRLTTPNGRLLSGRMALIK